MKPLFMLHTLSSKLVPYFSLYLTSLNGKVSVFVFFSIATVSLNTSWKTYQSLAKKAKNIFLSWKKTSQYLLYYVKCCLDLVHSRSLIDSTVCVTHRNLLQSPASQPHLHTGSIAACQHLLGKYTSFMLTSIHLMSYTHSQSPQQ